MRVPLLYKPGIQRDGTSFQDEYCTDGQWIRFVGGKIKKMNGQREVVSSNAGVNFTNTKYLFISLDNNLFCIKTDNTLLVGPFDAANAASVAPALVNIGNPDPINNANSRWQAINFIRNTHLCTALLQTYPDANGMLVHSMWWKQNDVAGDFTNAGIRGALANFTGGMIFSAPFLFVYGKNGMVYWSRNNNPLDFSVAANSVAVTTGEDVLFGALVRGGTNSPSLLFWTANSVVYFTNTAGQALVLNFQREIITRNSSLISPNAVVQYDSLFFWLGTDRIFVYNGIVDSIPNAINLEYFFYNVDLAKRNKIYGYKVARYGEIRWAYPEIANQGNPGIGCTRELVYNVRENSWYDTAIRRDCVTYRPSTGGIYSYGEAASNYPFNALNSYSGLWQHEIGTDEIRRNAVVPIPSYFCTPWYGLAAFNPTKSGNAIDKYIVLDQIEPDFPSFDARTPADVLTITIYGLKYASRGQMPLPLGNPVNFNLQDANQYTGKIDFMVSARFIQIRFDTVSSYVVGNVLLNFKEGDGQ